MRPGPLLSLLVLLAAAPAAAQPTQTFRSETGVSLDLPAHWTRVADEALDGVRRSALQAGEPVTYEVGYRASDAPFPAPPVVAFAWSRLPEKTTLKQFGAEFTGADARDVAQEEIDSTPAAALGGRVDAPWWDAAHGIAWLRMTLRSDGRTPAFSLMASTLHPAGDRVITLVYYGARGEDEARVRDALTTALRSIRVD